MHRIIKYYFIALDLSFQKKRSWVISAKHRTQFKVHSTNNLKDHFYFFCKDNTFGRNLCSHFGIFFVHFTNSFVDIV